MKIHKTQYLLSFTPVVVEEGMDPDIKCRRGYDFVDSIADGVYTIIIDGKPIEKVTFLNGKRSGFRCTYTQPFYGTISSKDKQYWFVENYKGGRVSEYFKIDKEGMVREYRPMVLDSLRRTRSGVTYYFDRKGSLRKIRYSNLADDVVSYFSKKGQYKKTDILGYQRYSKKRYQFRLTLVQSIGLVKYRKPNGLIEISMKGSDHKYTLHFYKGVLLSWSFTTDDPTESLSYNVSSNNIGVIIEDILNFINQ